MMFPVEIWEKIIAHVDAPTLTRLRTVNSIWNAIITKYLKVSIKVSPLLYDHLTYFSLNSRLKQRCSGIRCLVQAMPKRHSREVLADLIGKLALPVEPLQKWTPALSGRKAELQAVDGHVQGLGEVAER